MRCHYVSDLHLETQLFRGELPKGDVLIVAGDLCHASSLDPERTDKYNVEQRGRVMRFIDTAQENFRHVLLVMGNHDHYDGVFDATAGLFRKHLPGVSVLDNESIEIDGVCFFGTTLWSDFEGRSAACMNAVRRRVGEFFFVRKRARDADGKEILRKFQPEDALQAFDASVSALRHCLASAAGRQIVVISHHPPTRQGLNPRHAGNGLDGVYASDVEEAIRAGVHNWVHGHTHMKRTYRVGNTVFRTNCRGFDGRDASAGGFSARSFFEL